jgi:hypothetical protein
VAGGQVTGAGLIAEIEAADVNMVIVNWRFTSGHGPREAHWRRSRNETIETPGHKGLPCHREYSWR